MSVHTRSAPFLATRGVSGMCVCVGSTVPCGRGRGDGGLDRFVRPSRSTSSMRAWHDCTTRKRISSCPTRLSYVTATSRIVIAPSRAPCGPLDWMAMHQAGGSDGGVVVER
jgi:hypothetical protein